MFQPLFSVTMPSAWPILLPAALVMLAVYLLLPRPRGYPPLWGAAAGGSALVLAGRLLIWAGAAAVESLLFYAFSAIAIVAGGLLITQRNPARAALSFALVVLSTCGLFLLQAAPFLMAATIIIYAGAIVVTFLFVIMLAQQVGRADADDRSREPALACIAGFVLVAALLYLLRATYDTTEVDRLVERAAAAANQDSPQNIMAILGDDEAFMKEFRDALVRARNSPDSAMRADQLSEIRERWQHGVDRQNPEIMAEALRQLTTLGQQVRSKQGTVQPAGNTLLSSFSGRPPNAVNSDEEKRTAEGVAPLGRSLFTDYLLPVELAGLLLLVATIGAIAITHRRAGRTP